MCYAVALLPAITRSIQSIVRPIAIMSGQKQSKSILLSVIHLQMFFRSRSTQLQSLMSTLNSCNFMPHLLTSVRRRRLRQYVIQAINAASCHVHRFKGISASSD